MIKSYLLHSNNRTLLYKVTRKLEMPGKNEVDLVVTYLVGVKGYSAIHKQFG